MTMLAPRTADQIATQWVEELTPPGSSWSRDRATNLAALYQALAIPRAQLEADIATLTSEIWPGSAVTLLSDYQSLLGPDPLGRDVGDLSQAQLQQLLGQRWVASSGQTFEFYERMAASYGVTITIIEPNPAICGPAVCGEAICSDYTLRFYWIVNMDQDSANLRAAIALNAPADTIVVFMVQGVYV